jgi:hypothetical protein
VGYVLLYWTLEDRTDDDWRAVVAAEPCFENQRTENQTAPLFLDDVSQFLSSIKGLADWFILCRDWQHVFHKRYIREYSHGQLLDQFVDLNA